MLTASNARTNVVDSTVYETEVALLNLNILGAIRNGSTTANLTATTHTTFNGNVIVGSGRSIQCPGTHGDVVDATEVVLECVGTQGNVARTLSTIQS